MSIKKSKENLRSFIYRTRFAFFYAHAKKHAFKLTF